ncbi:MAG: dihydrofolate reductase [Cardiobacteriaceae bacterium]|nr:dihydrofolate reductase [Cardiobacteriaceae bacterium]
MPPERILIVAHSDNRVIGRDNAMPWHLPRDLRHFKQHTSGHPVIMGRKTYQSLGKALPNRANIVISRQALDLADARLAASLEEALALAAPLDAQCFIIGGAQIYAQALAADLVDTLLITEVHTHVDGDSFFPELDAARWQETDAEHVAADDANAHAMTFRRYVRKMR